MKNMYLFTIILSVCFIYANARPIFEDDDDWDKLFDSLKVDCVSKLGCPTGSTSCSKKTSTSQDKKTITTDIKCNDANGQLLNNNATPKVEANPNPGSIQNSYEYYGSYSGGSQTVSHDNHGSTNNVNNGNSGIEPLTK